MALEALRELAKPDRAAGAARFFKTGRGEYAEGDRFLGVAVPQIRRLVRDFVALPLPQCRALLASEYNEARLLALLVMVRQFHAGDERSRAQICRTYLRARRRVNNWNLVDSSAPQILGEQLRAGAAGSGRQGEGMRLLARLARSRSLWDRRIAVIATQAFIRANDFRPTLQLVPGLLEDEHDLMHKACGWMLRETGDRSPATLKGFLRRHHRRMPRTMLRYAIEKLPAAQRAAWLAGGRLPFSSKSS